MNQLWQSLAITAVVGGGILLFVTFGITHIDNSAPAGSAQVNAATSSPAEAASPASAVQALATSTDSFANLRLSGRAAIVVDLSDGHTLYSQNADAPRPLASLTKLLTLYEAGRILAPGSLVTISSSSLAQDGEYGLVEGETFAYSDLARFALVSSSNDAAEAIAEAAEAASGQSSAAFMAAAVRDTGLQHTQATNGTGLDIDATEAGAYGTARDIAKLAAAFLSADSDISKATTRSTVTAYSTTGIPHSLSNTNPDVNSMTGLLLSKTGYTDLAGGNLAVVFDAGIGHQVAVVVLGSTPAARFTDVERLMRATRASLAKSPNL